MFICWITYHFFRLSNTCEQEIVFAWPAIEEETFVGDKNKLAKLSGVFSYIVGVATILLPFGLEKIGDVVGIVYAILIVLGTIVFLY